MAGKTVSLINIVLVVRSCSNEFFDCLKSFVTDNKDHKVIRGQVVIVVK